ncbi:Uncharacterized protein TSPI_06926 [Trichinella spiralis]|uniref:Uncharacterized protein n=1 Tax=Trichinella spiralis TaxID=6334 RepID=A0ABR3K1M3_TRISP
MRFMEPKMTEEFGADIASAVEERCIVFLSASTSPSGTPFTSNFTTQLADGLEATMDRHLGSFALSICWPTFASARIIAPSFECRLFVIFYIVHPETDQLNNYPSTPMTESFKLHGVADYRHPHRHIWRA